MMNYQELLKIAEIKLTTQFPEVVSDIKLRISSGSTGGEITAMVGKYLKDLERTNPQAYNILRNEIKAYLDDCKKQGLIIS